jgi:hypothetical protein
VSRERRAASGRAVYSESDMAGTLSWLAEVHRGRCALPAQTLHEARETRMYPKIVWVSIIPLHWRENAERENTDTFLYLSN